MKFEISRDLRHFTGDFTYLGKSKANIDDLFEVRDDLPDKWKVRQVNL